MAGDILINTRKFGHAGLGVCNSMGRALTTLSSPATRAIDVIHATNDGIVYGWGLKAYVYRPNDLTYGDARKIARIADEIRSGSQYGAARAVFKSWSGSSAFGKDARTRLAKYRERLALRDTAGGTTPIVKHVFCSEFVILCYQLALGEDHRLFIRLDAMHTLPSGLKKHLDQNAANWRMVGEIDAA
ncbi:hypothetical protein HND93_01700 [Azospirillum sp. ROY-1-1-2]|uniref:Uncharacterized protein n=2 Tax=Azospirillum oleiclasticum TaxID=2735135 RepID=A0ABX2T550_9PROT|nr:hypothetical protein [Azospirillum oleiclasticum]NYZ18411.1 hypothetical protein [Azospirillum oleiclasticum]